MSDIQYCDKNRIEEVVNDPKSHGNYGKFLYKSDEGWVACDNTTADAWVECFNDLNTAINWLNGKFEISGYRHLDDSEKEEFKKKIWELGVLTVTNSPYWILSKEKLPELLTPVLIFSPIKHTGITNIGVGWITGYYDDGSPIWVSSDLSDPSHWAPCPYLPDGAVIEDKIECRNERRN